MDPNATDGDSAKPTAAGMYDYFLNGRNHRPVDEEAARIVLKTVPEAHYMAHANRLFLQRAAAVIARAGVRQFIDVGAGLPAGWNSHEVAQVVDPDISVVYVDNDPGVVAESRELLRRSGDKNVTYIQGDIRDPASILDNDVVRERIDFSRPVGYMHIAVWHFVADEDRPHDLIRRYLDAVPEGSHLALSHSTTDGQKPDKVERFNSIYKNATSKLHFRTREEIDRFFEGLEYLPPYEGAEPGLSFVDLWGSKNPEEVDPSHTWVPCAVARKG